MNSEDPKRQEYFRRIRRLKRILRPLPRRSNVHRYPVLKWFAKTARKRAHLWSMRRDDIIPALYVGSIAGMLPMPAPQIPICFVFALLLRCNLVIAAALTLISNPFTFIPLYLASNRIGSFVLGTFWHPSLNDEITPEVIEVVAEQTGHGLPSLKFFQWYGETVLGGILLGAIIGGVLHACYQLIVNYSAKRRGEYHFGLLGRFKHHAETAQADDKAAADESEKTLADGLTSEAPAAESAAETAAKTSAESPVEKSPETAPPPSEGRPPFAPPPL